MSAGGRRPEKFRAAWLGLFPSSRALRKGESRPADARCWCLPSTNDSCSRHAREAHDGGDENNPSARAPRTAVRRRTKVSRCPRSVARALRASETFSDSPAQFAAPRGQPATCLSTAAVSPRPGRENCPRGTRMFGRERVLVREGQGGRTLVVLCRRCRPPPAEGTRSRAPVACDLATRPRALRWGWMSVGS